MSIRTQWKGLIFCFLATLLLIGFTINGNGRTNIMFINESNYNFAEQIGKNKIITPRTWHHSVEQEKRLQHLRQFCITNRDTYGIKSLLAFVRTREENKAHFYMSEKRKLIYCGVPKVASTNWKRLLLLFESAIESLDAKEVKDKNKVHYMPQQRLFSMISKESVKQVIFNYYKFLFVRHPFERLTSAYRDKFVKRNVYYQTLYGSKILRRFRVNLTENEYRRGIGVTFEEFARFITEPGSDFDAHWASVDKLCYPCVLPYNFIGKMETLLEDTEQVLHDIKSAERFPINKTDGNRISSKSLVEIYFSTLQPTLIQKLYDKYKTDFAAFGYDVPEFIKEHVQNETKKDSLINS